MSVATIVQIFGAALVVWSAARFYIAEQGVPQIKAVTIDSSAQSIQSINPGEDLIIGQDHAGRYMAKGRINNSTVDMLMDTGATHTAIPYKLSIGLGLQRMEQVYAQSASETVKVWRSHLRQLTVAGHTVYDVDVLIMPPASEGDHLLIGNDILDQFDISIRNRVMRLRPLT